MPIMNGIFLLFTPFMIGMGLLLLLIKLNLKPQCRHFQDGQGPGEEGAPKVMTLFCSHLVDVARL